MSASVSKPSSLHLTNAQKQLLKISGVAITYFLMMVLAFNIWKSPDAMVLFWPGAGIGLAAVILFGYPMLIGVAVGVFLSMLTRTSEPIILILFPVAHVLQAGFGHYLLARTSKFRWRLDSVRDVLKLVYWGAFISTLSSAFIVVFATASINPEVANNLIREFIQWWLRFGMGVVIFSPLILTWYRHSLRQRTTQQLIEFSALTTILAIITLMIFGTIFRNYPLGHVLFPFLMWMALRLKPADLSFASLIIAVIAGAGTAQGVGPFARFNDSFEQIVLFWTFITAVSVTAQLMVAVLEERRQSEDKIRQSESRFRSIFDGAYMGIAVANKEGQILSANPAFQQLMGYTEVELQQKRFADFTHPDDIDTNLNLYKEIRTGSIDKYQIEKRYINKKGDTIWASLYSTLIPDPNSDEEVHLGMVSDITEQRSIEANKLVLAVQQERIQIIDKFIQNASHEFKTPISNIKTQLYLLQKSLNIPESNRYVKTIKHQSEKLIQLVESLATMSHLDSEPSFSQGYVDISVILRTLLETRRRDFNEKFITFQSSLHERLYVEGNIDYLEITFSRLLDNAIAFTQESDRIHVKAYLDAETDEVVVEIKDTGQGIPEAIKAHIFERFYRGDDAHTTRGFGLGLPIAKKIVEVHKGTITIESQEGIGTTVFVRLPMIPETMREMVLG